MGRREERREKRGPVSASALLWAYALGVVSIGCLPQLPSWEYALGAASLLFCVGWLLRSRTVVLPLLLAVLAGAAWGLWFDRNAYEQRLPLSAHGADFRLEVELVSLPQIRSDGRVDGSGERRGRGGESADVRFSVRVQGSAALPQPLENLRGQLLDLTWYRADAGVREQLRAGSRWVLPVRLKRPRGSVNPHGFDYEGWLLQRGVYATGYVRPQDGAPQYLGERHTVAALRHRLRDELQVAAPDAGGLLAALLLGDRSGLSDAERKLLRETGTAHLLAISGLHVGLVAGFFLLLGNLLRRGIGAITGSVSLGLSVALALAGSLIYTLLAGAPLSARRALVMTWVLLLAWSWRRRVSPGFAFGLALALVLTLQPLAFYSAGFWLSFIAVGALLLGFSGRLRLSGRGDGESPRGLGRFWRAGIELLRSQWLVAVGLLLPSLVFFQGFSPAGFLLNLIAIPWLGFLVLPPLLVGAAMMGTAAGGACIDFAAWQVSLLMAFLDTGRAALPAWQTLGPPVGSTVLVLAALGAFLLLLPRGLPGRRLGWLFLLPPLVPALAALEPGGGSGEERLRVTVLDVGQGLSVVLRSLGYTLLYDTGPRSPSGWSAGSQIVVPYLLGEGAGVPDAVVVSHGDNDHSGGFEGLNETLVPKAVIVPGRLSRELPIGPAGNMSSCRAGERETVGELELHWLWPEAGDISGGENDHSCVLLVRWRERRILLAGDISRGVEQKLLRRYPELGPVDLLIAPHHGSRSSSSPEFVRWAGPAEVVFSAGFRHHFGHPHAEVVARYREAGARTWNTADTGALTFEWLASGPLQITRARSAGRFWYREPR